MLRKFTFACLTGAIAKAIAVSVTADDSDDFDSEPVDELDFPELTTLVQTGDQATISAKTQAALDQMSRLFTYKNWKKNTSAQQKQRKLMEAIKLSQVTKPYDYDLAPFFARAKNQIFTQNHDVITDRDTNPKLIHQKGVVAPVRYESVGDHGYTGMFASGAQYGVMRLSDAGFQIEGVESSNPTVALKFFRDNNDSQNLLFGIDFNNQDTLNPFPKWPSGWHKAFTTHPLPFNAAENQCELQTMTAKFVQRTFYPFAVGTNHFSRVTEDDSEEIKKPWYPFEVQLRPSKHVIPDYEPGTDSLDYLTGLAGNNDKPLFSVYAKLMPDDEFEKIGKVFMTESPVRSWFADQYLHFQHTNFRNDIHALDLLDRLPMYQAWTNAERRRVNVGINGDNRQPIAVAPWDANREVPAMEGDLQEIVESGIMGTLVDGMNCPFAWVLQ